MYITETIKYIGVNDHNTDLFEGQYSVPNGMAYNSYLIIDDKIAVMDTVDREFTREWLKNIENILGNRKPDYLVVQHMEPDHSANIDAFLKKYPDAFIVSSDKSFRMMGNFFGTEYAERRMIVEEGDTLCLGNHTLTFITAPMVHWPEVIVTYDSLDKVLFSADGFGKFGALDADEKWTEEARRYYIGIVGKYGVQVQALLRKVENLDIEKICPLHGPVLTENLGYYFNLYNIWSSYEAETDGIMIAYTSVYGNTRNAVLILSEMLKERGCPKVAVYDLSRADMSLAISEAFRYGRLILATTTYNAEIFPPMRGFIQGLTERGYKNRRIGLIENGSWAPSAVKIMKEMFSSSENITIAENTVRILSAVNGESRIQLKALADELCRDYISLRAETADKNNLTALNNIGYGLYAVTSRLGEKDNAIIVNTVTQVTDTPNRIAVTINKQNYSHDIIKETGTMNVNCLSIDAPFSIFEAFGFKSGRDTDKFENIEAIRSDNGLFFLKKYINSFMSLKVEQYLDMGTHGMFICSITEARVISDRETMTYSYYHKHVKPKPQTEGKKGFVCKICGYVYEGARLPEDFICPLCKHGASDFEPIE